METTVKAGKKAAKAAKIAEETANVESAKIQLTISQCGVTTDETQIWFKFNEEETAGLSYFLRIEWVHNKMRDLVGSLLGKRHLKVLIGSSIYCDSVEAYEAGDQFTTRDGKTITLDKDRLELTKAGLVINEELAESIKRQMKKQKIWKLEPGAEIHNYDVYKKQLKKAKKNAKAVEAVSSSAKSTLNF